MLELYSYRCTHFQVSCDDVALIENIGDADDCGTCWILGMTIHFETNDQQPQGALK